MTPNNPTNPVESNGEQRSQPSVSPRTDAVFMPYLEGAISAGECLSNAKELSRQLETELTAATAQIAELKKERDEILHQLARKTHGASSMCCCLRQEERARAEQAERERDELKKQSEEARNSHTNDIEDAFVDRLFARLDTLGVNTENWDGEDSPEGIIASNIANLKTERDEAVAKLAEAQRDASRWRWMRSDGLSFVKWEGLTTDTSDVGLDYAADSALDLAKSATEQK